MTTADTKTQAVAIWEVPGGSDLLEQALAPHLSHGAKLIFPRDRIDHTPQPDKDPIVIAF